MWFNSAKIWIGYNGKSKKLKKIYRKPLECNTKPFRSLRQAKKFQKEFCKPYPHIYILKTS